MNDDVKTLPEECCAKCGFFFGVQNKPASQENAIIDPDHLRDVKYPPNGLNPMVPNRSVITTYRHEIKFKIPDGYESSEYSNAAYPNFREEKWLRWLRWDDIESFNCYWNVFPPKRIPHDTSMLHQDVDRYGNDYVPIVSQDVLKTIRDDRSECLYFFKHHPGLMPNQHAELRFQEIRDNNQQEFQDRQNKLFLQYEKIAAEREAYWKPKEDKDRNYHKVVILLALIVSIIALCKDIIVEALTK